MYVYVIVVSQGSNLVYKLNYLFCVVIYLNARNCKSNNICSFIKVGVSYMLPPAVCSNDPVRLRVQLSKKCYESTIVNIP